MLSARTTLALSVNSPLTKRNETRPRGRRENTYKSTHTCVCVNFNRSKSQLLVGVGVRALEKHGHVGETREATLLCNPFGN